MKARLLSAGHSILADNNLKTDSLCGSSRVEKMSIKGLVNVFEE